MLAPACISQDHPRALSFVPSAPTEASALFDLVVGASSIYGGSWLEGSGAVHAENQALRWIADLAGLPDHAGGCFVSGGSAGNLSALVAARHAAAEARTAAGRERPARWRIAASAEAHSSIASTARVMDIDVIDAPVDDRGRLTGAALARTLDELDAGRPDGHRRPVRRGGHRRHDQRRHRRRPGRRGRRSPPTAGSGSTSTAPTAARPWPHRAHEPTSTASSAPTRS